MASDRPRPPLPVVATTSPLAALTAAVRAQDEQNELDTATVRRRPLPKPLATPDWGKPNNFEPRTRAEREAAEMPDAATIDAATPKCPVGPNRPGLMEAPEPCNLRLSFDAECEMWVCPVHGNVTTIQSLVHRQGATDAAL